jgi:DNA-binding transcriptional MerR regulator
MPADEAPVTIGALSAATGVSVSVLRSWEQRYGFPQAMRSSGGHRRYSASTIARIDDVLRQRAGGLSLGAAIALVREHGRSRSRSFAEGVRACWSHLQPQLLTKRAMLAFSRVLEDECCARADRPLVIGAFQHERFYRMSERRWRSLHSTARAVVALADFPGDVVEHDAPVEIALGEHAAALREWVVICDAPDRSACLIGWERPVTPATGRVFEAVWSADPAVVRDATEIAIGLATSRDPVHERLRDGLRPPSTDATAALRLAELVAVRVAESLDVTDLAAGRS